ncbi:MAG: hypothetical protein ABJG78_15245 [Cyclobacteriaceae bacterium]
MKISLFLLLSFFSFYEKDNSTVEKEDLTLESDLAIQNLRVTSLNGTTVSCLQPNTTYRVKFNVTSPNTTCACVQLVDDCTSGNNSSYFFLNQYNQGDNPKACIDTGTDLNLRFVFGGDPIIIKAFEGCNPPFTNGSSIVDIESKTYDQCNSSGCACSSPPSIPGIIKTYHNTSGSANHTICSYDLANSDFFVESVAGASSYEWRVSPSTGVNWDQTGSRFMHFLHAPPGQYALDVRAINDCGVGPWSGVGVTVQSCGSDGGF